MNQLTLAKDEERKVQLEACENRIFSAFRRGLEATCDIGKELRTIEADTLYDVRGYQNLIPYAERELRMDERSVRRSMNILSVIERLEGSGVQLPSNESQLIELARLPDERVLPVWERLVKTCDKKDVPITIFRVREAVNLDEEPAKPARGGVQANISLDETEPLTEAGEKALARIRRICGEDIAKAIESGAVTLPEKALIKWAELKDQLMRNLVYYIIDQRWTVAQAIAYEEKKITGHSTLEDMILLARARGGHVAIQHDEFLVTIERAAAAA
jgi:hypothetical protein